MSSEIYSEQLRSKHIDTLEVLQSVHSKKEEYQQLYENLKDKYEQLQLDHDMIKEDIELEMSEKYTLQLKSIEKSHEKQQLILKNEQIPLYEEIDSLKLEIAEYAKKEIEYKNKINELIDHHQINEKTNHHQDPVATNHHQDPIATNDHQDPVAIELKQNKDPVAIELKQNKSEKVKVIIKKIPSISLKRKQKEYEKLLIRFKVLQEKCTKDQIKSKALLSDKNATIANLNNQNILYQSQLSVYKTQLSFLRQKKLKLKEINAQLEQELMKMKQEKFIVDTTSKLIDIDHNQTIKHHDEHEDDDDEQFMMTTLPNLNNKRTLFPEFIRIKRENAQLKKDLLKLKKNYKN